MGTYFVRDDETRTVYSFSYAHVVTEGFPAIRTGERVRFLTDPADAGHAVYVIRLELSDVEAYYEELVDLDRRHGTLFPSGALVSACSWLGCHLPSRPGLRESALVFLFHEPVWQQAPQTGELSLGRLD